MAEFHTIHTSSPHLPTPAGSHGSSTQHPSAFGNIVRSFTWVDAMGEVHTSHEPARFIGTLGLFGIITEVTVEVSRCGKVVPGTIGSVTCCAGLDGPTPVQTRAVWNHH